MGFIIVQLLSLNVMADWIETEYLKFEGVDLGANYPESQIPVIGNVTNNGKELNLYYDGIDYANVSVKDSNGTIVYQGQFNTSSRKSINVDLNSYQQGNYTINVEDSEGNIAVGNFQVKK